MLDHLLWGVPALDEGIRDFADRCGVRAAIGGRHPGVGTHNALLALDNEGYLEIIARDPSQDQFSGFGLMLRDLKEPCLVTWAARSEDIEQVIKDARGAGLRPEGVIEMSRRKPDGEVVAWRLVQIGGHPWGTLLPFFIQWLTPHHPSQDAPPGCRLESFTLAHPDPSRLKSVLSRLGLEVPVEVASEPGLRAALETPYGRVALSGPPDGVC